MVCEWSEKINALYDGETSATERADIESHALSCAPCANELAKLRSVGRFLKAGAPPVPSISELSPLYGRIKATRTARLTRKLMEPRVIRLAQWLTSAAAAIMVACGLALTKSPAQQKVNELSSLSSQNWTALALGVTDDQYAISPSAGDPFSPAVEDSREEVRE